MQTALLIANFTVKLAAACVFAHDGDMYGALAFTIAAPLTTWLWSL